MVTIMQVPNQHAERKWIPRGAGRVFSDASLADPTIFIDQGGKHVLRLWLPGGIAVEEGPVPWNLYLNGTLDEHNGFVVTKFWVEQRPGGPGMSASMLRDVPFAELVDELLSRPPVAQMVRRTDGPPTEWPKVDMPVPPELLAEARRRTQPQRGRRANAEERRARLEQVAKVARAAPHRGVLRALGGPPLHLTRGVAKKLLHEARDAGLLGESEQSARARGRNS